ncbi:MULTISPECIES: carboxyl transferase domain-containing protein [Arthrobacter]|uniref:Carboxyl transferase domain-containing protein n=2 Tax=Arthrobacter TaxID=1663 RepID=A0ABU9KN50_9MICC|nr:carboxyl transferase domain-containing protein [Arthrobacter sp. YJM1]MDP5228284.1 carboxyl transferase domain-containing protein [Arthrobacter sp. YJM1]
MNGAGSAVLDSRASSAEQCAAVSHRPGARQVLDGLLDPGSFRSWDVAPDPVDDAGYAAALERAAARSGTDEAVLTGEGGIDGRAVAVVVSEFAFLGGSIGERTADRIVAAIEEAGRRRLPLIAAPASGGTRMQEGTPAFLQMVRVTRALVRYKDLGLPYLVYLRHPTTGGVFASWGSLGHLTVAEPGALIGFLGPKVYEGLKGEPFPQGVQLAEHLREHGTVDAVLDLSGFREMASAVLAILEPCEAAVPVPSVALGSEAPESVAPGSAAKVPDPGAWASVLKTREPGRPGLWELLVHGFGRTVGLRGTGRGRLSSSVAVLLAELAGRPVVVVGHDRAAQHQGAALDAAGLAQARRGMALAESLGIPLVTVVDTPGAELSVRAEEEAIACAIADCVADLAKLSVPSVAILLGEGTGGGALALAATRWMVAAADAWLAPLPPEGASLIVQGDVDGAPRLAVSQGIGARSLAARGLVHDVVPEDGKLLENLAWAAARRLGFH